MGSRAKKTIKATDYRHDSETRTNIPPAKIASEGHVPPAEKVTYSYSPHRSPRLQFDPTGGSAHEPWLEWAGRHEEDRHEVFKVDPVALHIHERVSAQAIVRTATRDDVQKDLFADPAQPYREAVQFYRHDIDWANRLILGDSLQVMASLAHREGLVDKVQMIYIDPPYGIRFSSNFQPELRRRTLRETDGDLTREPETVRAYRDTWQLGVHSYLSYLRTRLILARELLAPTGSIFVQISDANVHLVRSLLDDVFGRENFENQIAFQTTTSATAKTLPHVHDYLLWYAKSKSDMKFNRLYLPKESGKTGTTLYRLLRLPNGAIRSMAPGEQRGEESIPEGARRFRSDNLTSQSAPPASQFAVEVEGFRMRPGRGGWKTGKDGFRRLLGASRIYVTRNATAQYARYLDDFPVTQLNNVWTDVGTGSFTDPKRFVVQTNPKVIQRCILMTTDPGDLVLDPTCGGGTTAYAAERWGRRWITIDTSRVAVSLTRQRLLTASYDHYTTQAAATTDGAADPSSGFLYETAPHVELRSITRNVHLDPILEKHEGTMTVLLRQCNDALQDVDERLRTTLQKKLQDKQDNEGARAITEADRRRWLLPPNHRAWNAKQRAAAIVDEDYSRWYEWEVPYDTDPAYPASLQHAVERYREGWRARQEEVDACIAANSDSVEVVDQPEIETDVLRVSGPFTVEGVRPEEASAFDGSAARRELEPRNAVAYLSHLVDLLRRDGVTFPNNQNRRFRRIEPLFESGTTAGTSIHAEARWHEVDDDGPNDVAVCFGPQYGSVTAEYVEDIIRASRRYDELVIAGFSFDGEAQAVIEESPHPKLTIHQAYIRPDVNPAMDGLLGITASDQLFTVFGQPDVRLRRHSEGEWVCELRGVDIYDPVKSTVQQTEAAKVAAWFLDEDFDGRCFCITQAFFPNQGAWEKIARDLQSATAAEAFTAFDATRSLPFHAGTHRRIAVKVIDPRGNEVMTIKPLDQLEQE